MLKNHLTDIKGRLTSHFYEVYFGMNSDKDGTDYDEFFTEFSDAMNQIVKIKSVDDLDFFCEDFGLNDLDPEFPLSFPNLAKKYLGFNEEGDPQGK